MNISEKSIKFPYLILAISLAISVMGVMAFFRTHTDLFPNSTPPQVAILTFQPGAAAKDVADKITQVIEKEVSTINDVKTIRSTSRDEVSSINIEFYYRKPIGEAVIDVQNAISRISSKLPQTIKTPEIYRITDTTRSLLTLSLSPKKTSSKTLKDIRILAENHIMDTFLNIDGVGDVDIFGGNKAEVNIRLDKQKLVAHNLSISQVIQILQQHNINSPSGNIYSSRNEFIVKTYDEFKNLNDIRDVPIQRFGNGTLHLRDIAKISLTTQEERSFYHGNGTPAIAINIMRLPSAGTVQTINNIKHFLPKLKQQYPDIDFQLTTDQSPTIKANTDGMRSSLIQAIFLTALIIFIFLADFRAAIVVAVSIPMAFCFSLVVLWLTPFTLNMVTLSGLIISVGMVVDASIVVLENIYRHYQSPEKPSAKQAAIIGTKEVTLSIVAGVLTTVIVLVPVMYTGGYTQQIMRPLNLMIVSTLLASLLAALTIVPLLCYKLLSKPKQKKNPIERFFNGTSRLVDKLGDFYGTLLHFILRHRIITIIFAFALFAVTMKNVTPIIGKELMPPMDTGISIINLEFPASMAIGDVEKTVTKVEAILKKQKHLITISTLSGSEPGEMSFGGGGRITQSVQITTRLVPRDKREITIWDVNKKWRKEIAKLSGIKSFSVTEYGATPMSTTKAPLDVIVSGPDKKMLSKIADDIIKKLRDVPGLIDVQRSWDLDKIEYQLRPNEERCAVYGVTPGMIATNLKSTLKGDVIGSFNLEDFLDIPIRIQYKNMNINTPEALSDIYVPTAKGLIQTREFTTLTKEYAQPFITRETQNNTIDITGYNSVYTIGQVYGMVEKKLKGMKTPAGYSINVSGTMSNMREGNARMAKALIIGLVLLYMLLLAMFKSFFHPITIMSAIPLAVFGAIWGLLLFDKPMCKPAMMGIIFLGGTIVNNSILLLDFIITAREGGMEKNEAIIQSVKLRLRPILMTTVSTIIGLTPLIFEMSVGLERMSPLGIVAAFGLATGTVMTLLVMPAIYSLIDSLEVNTKRFIGYIFN